MGFENVIHDFIGFSKSHKDFRSTGLTMGYDVNGLILLITGYYLYLVRGKTLVSFVVFIVALFTSRVTIILSLLSLIVITIMKIGQRKNIARGIVLIAGVSIGLYSFYQSMGRFLLASVTLTQSSDLISTSYSRTTSKGLLETLFVVPGDVITWIFGRSIFPKTDSGYLQMIFACGMLGLIMTIFYYFSLRSLALRNLKGLKFNSGKLFINLIFFFTFLLSIKNQYFFTRGIFELTVLIIMIYERKYSISSKI